MKIDFEVKDGKLISKTKLPKGEGYQVVLQAKATLEAKTNNFRINLQLYPCKECGNLNAPAPVTSDTVPRLHQG